MGDTGIGALLVRTLLSLAVVLAIVGIGYVIAKRRAGRSATTRPRLSLGSARRARRTVSPLEVVGRVGLSRSSALVAVRFGDRVVLVTAGDGTPASVVTEMSAEQWDELQTVREAIDPAALAAMSGSASATRSASSAEPHLVSMSEVSKPGFVEALRQATARYA